MPVILSVKPDSLRGTRKLDGDGSPSRDYEVIYTVRGDTQNDDPNVIALTESIPRVGDNLNGMICKKVMAEEQDTFAYFQGTRYGLWEVKVQFDSDQKLQADRTDEDGNILPPQDWTPDWSWDYEEITEVAEQDWALDPDSQPIINALGDQIIIEVPRVIPVLTIRRYEVSFDPNIQYTYGNHVNKTSFWGAPPGAALMMPPRDSIADRPNPFTGNALRMVEYTIKFSNRQANPYSWRRNPAGSYGYEAVTGLIGWASNPLAKSTHYYEPLSPGGGLDPDYAKGTFPFLDSRSGQPTEGLIYYTGVKLIQPGIDLTALQPHYYVFQPYQSAELNDLMLGPF